MENEEAVMVERDDVDDVDHQGIIGKESKEEEEKEEEEDLLTQLIEENTPGGINRQLLANLSSRGVQTSLRLSMSAALQRIRKQSDGSLQ